MKTTAKTAAAKTVSTYRVEIGGLGRGCMSFGTPPAARVVEVQATSTLAAERKVEREQRLSAGEARCIGRVR